MTLHNILFYFLQHHLPPQPARLKYVGANDELLLEDQMQRIKLTGNISPKELVTGGMGREAREGGRRGRRGARGEGEGGGERGRGGREERGRGGGTEIRRVKSRLDCSDLQVLLLVFWVRSFAVVSLRWRTTVLLSCLSKMSLATWKPMEKTSEEGQVGQERRGEERSASVRRGGKGGELGSV